MKINITDKDLKNENVSIYFNARENELMHAFEPLPGLFIAESPKVITRAIDAGYEPVSLMVCEEELHKEGKILFDLIDDEIPVYCISETLLKSIRGFNLTNGCMCAMKRKSQEALVQFAADKKRLCVLDNVENPTNVGAIIRSAAALGMDGVILTKGCADPLYRRAARVSMGTVFQVPWTVTENEDYIEKLNELNFSTVAMALKEDSLNIDDRVLKASERLAVILGNEGEGLSNKKIEACRFRVMIPMDHGVDSLNVSNAASIAFWELGKRK